MKQEDKELLLRDLCARLPYKVIGERTWTAPVTGSPEKMKTVFSLFDIEALTTGYSNCGKFGYLKIENYSFKPYLFPLSSMTFEQECKYREVIASTLNHYEVYDWLNKNHFDYRGLIEKGLAINATELNIY